MNRTEIKEVLREIYEGADIGDYDKLRLSDNSTIEIDSFVELFGDCDLTLSSLSQHEVAKNTAWGDKFIEWNQKGILPD